jgi:hypothetical protein
MQILSEMSEDNVQYKLTNKFSKEEIKLDDIYYEPNTTASDIKIGILHLFSFQTPILTAKKTIKRVKSIVGISPTMDLLFPLLFWYLKR